MQPSPPKHLARRGGRPGRTGNPDLVLHSLIAVGVVLAMVIVLANLPDRRGSNAASREQVPDQSAASTTSPPAVASFGNLVSNWSFEQDLSGWEVVGAATAASEPPGRTSGSAASVRANGARPGRVGLALPGAGKDARKGGRYGAPRGGGC